MIRIDKGIEIGIMVIIYVFFCRYYIDVVDFVDIILYGLLILN